jgi:EmrB/QacA subfamily drug resistance transporter
MSDTATLAVPPESVRRPAHPDLILCICCMSLLLVGMDVTIVNVALPSIGKDFRAKMAGLQWVFDAYTLVVASFLMLAGATGDRVGRRRTFQAGMALFTFGSLLCSVAPNLGCLIAFRAVQALGASMLNPVAISIIANVFTEPAARARAFGVWGTVAGLSLAVGPVVGGFLVEHVGWRSVFWVNLPIGAAALVLTARYVTESKAARPRAIDAVGQTMVFVALATLTSAVIEVPHMGWSSPTIVGLFAAAAAAVVAFVLYEPRRVEPLLDLRFFSSVPFSSATVIAVCAFLAFAGFLFLNTLYLQQARGLSAQRTGLYTLPLAAGMAACAPLSARLLAARGTRIPLLLAGAALAGSCLALTRLSVATPLPLLLATYLLFGIGLGMVNPPIAHTAVSGMPAAQAGVAAAVASTSRQVGAALGVAVAGSIVAAARARGVPFTEATHAVWWGLVGCGVLIAILGWTSSTPWARASVERLKHLLAPGE